MYRKYRKLSLYLAILFFSFILITISNIYVQIGCFLGIYIICLLSIDLNITHPYVWFIPIFILYSIGYPLLYTHGYIAVLPNCGQIELNSKMLILHWSALVTFIIVVSNKQIKYNHKYNYKLNSFVITTGLCVSLAIIYLELLIILRSGLSSKREILDTYSSQLFFRLGKVSIQLVPLLCACIIGDVAIPLLLKRIWIFIIAVTMTLTVLIIGERSAVLQTAIVCMLSYNIFIKKIHFKKALLYALAILSFIVIGVQLKALFLTNKNLKVSTDPLWVKFFNAEFSCASINTTNILNQKDYWNFQYGVKYLFLIFTPFNFFPLSFLLNKIGLPYIFSMKDNSTWYHEIILAGTRSGYGFSMVADGYIELGIWGVILVYGILGLIIKYLYEKSSHSLLFLIGYVTIVPIFIYSTRASFLYFFNYSIKYIVVPLIILSLFKMKKIKNIHNHLSKYNEGINV